MDNKSQQYRWQYCLFVVIFYFMSLFMDFYGDVLWKN